MLLVIISWEFMFRIWCLNYYSTSALRCGCRASYASCEKDRCEFELERNVQRCSLAIPDLSTAAHTANMSFTLRGKLAFMFFWKWWKSSRLLKASKSRYVNSFIFFSFQIYFDFNDLFLSSLERCWITMAIYFYCTTALQELPINHEGLMQMWIGSRLCCANFRRTLNISWLWNESTKLDRFMWCFAAAVCDLRLIRRREMLR